MRAQRWGEFERRSLLYSRLDGQLQDRTRFFAAAALVNSAFARLFEFGPALGGPDSFRFLSQVGTALEAGNVLVARRIGQGILTPGLDELLVCAEQSQLQQYVRAHRGLRPQQWQAVRRELNGLLNERSAATFISRWCEEARSLFRVLRHVRGCLGREIDFEEESHRIYIGMTLIEDVRRQGANVGTDLRGLCAHPDRWGKLGIIS